MLAPSPAPSPAGATIDLATCSAWDVVRRSVIVHPDQLRASLYAFRQARLDDWNGTTSRISRQHAEKLAGDALQVIVLIGDNVLKRSSQLTRSQLVIAFCAAYRLQLIPKSYFNVILERSTTEGA